MAFRGLIVATALVSLAFAATPAIAQQVSTERIGTQRERCYHAFVSARERSRIEKRIASHLKQRTRRARSRRSAMSASTESYQIPVYLHVISSGPSPEEGNVSDEVIADQLFVLNQSFNGQSGGSRTAFSFSLAGVTRSVNPAWASMAPGTGAEQEAKAALRQGTAGSLNVYVTDPGDGLLGWATFPWEYARRPVDDGVVISFRTLPGGSFEQYNEGDTLTHETGHWLGLFHTFEGGCRSGDGVTDTPAEGIPGYGCPIERDSCPRRNGVDPIYSFMDYSDDYCMFAFTAAQSSRMLGAFGLFREGR